MMAAAWHAGCVQAVMSGNPEVFMKRTDLSNVLFSAAALVWAAVSVMSCGPSAYVLDIETSHPSASGISLEGKSVSVVYLADRQDADSAFAADMASAFVSRLEDDYFEGDSIVPLFCLDKKDGVDYSSKTEMVNLLVDTGTDVVFVLDTPVFGHSVITRGEEGAGDTYVAEGAFPFSVSMYVYDALDPRDTVRQFSGSTIANVSAQVSGTESADGLEYILKSQLDGTAATVGRTSGSKFAPVWKSEEIVFFLYGSQDWYNSYYFVNDYKWQEAMDIWMSMLDTGNLEMKACLEYNLAAACYIQGHYELAKEWLDMSEKHFDLPYVSRLRQMIQLKSE